jgi:hypothetical protein
VTAIFAYGVFEIQQLPAMLAFEEFHCVRVFRPSTGDHLSAAWIASPLLPPVIAPANQAIRPGRRQGCQIKNLIRKPPGQQAAQAAAKGRAELRNFCVIPMPLPDFGSAASALSRRPAITLLPIARARDKPAQTAVRHIKRASDAMLL